MSRALPAFLAALLLAALPCPARADDGERDALLTLEGQGALRDLLWNRVLLVTSRRPAAAMEDLSLLPERHGQAVRIIRDRKVEVLTAGPLVDGGGEVRVMRAAEPGETVTKAGAVDEASLLVPLECEGACARAPAVDPAPPETWEPRRLLFFVVAALADQPVLGHTASLGRQAEPFAAMIAVAGKLPLGTVLFDATGRAVAVTVRNMPTRTDRTLAAVLSLPKPDAPGEEAAGKSGDARSRDGRTRDEGIPRDGPEPPPSEATPERLQPTPDVRPTTPSPTSWLHLTANAEVRSCLEFGAEGHGVQGPWRGLPRGEFRAAGASSSGDKVAARQGGDESPHSRALRGGGAL